MKKMMMFLMVSVFFLMGGMTDGVAQKSVVKAEPEPEPRVFQTPTSMLKRPGETAVMEYVINGIKKEVLYFIYVYVQEPEKAPELLYILGTDGVTRYPNPKMQGRMTVSYSSSKQGGFITINNLKAEDTGIYYVAIEVNGTKYFGRGTMLTVNSNPPILNKALAQKVPTSIQK